MRQLLTYTSVILVLIQRCGSTSETIAPSEVRAFHGRGFQSFQVEEYRIWLFDSEWPGDSCKASALVAGLCRMGIVTGKMFHVAVADSNGPTPSTPLVSENKPNLDEDFRDFRGKPTYIEHTWFRSIQRGAQVDTLSVGLSVDLSGKLPGPMMIFGLTLTCGKSSTPCKGEVDDPRLVNLQFEGWVL